MFKKLAFVRWGLFIGLILSCLYALFGIYYKINFLNFSLIPQTKTPVWTIESHIVFQPVDKDVKVLLPRAQSDKNFKVLDESIIAKGYDVEEGKDKFILSAHDVKSQQDIYYRLLIYDVKPNNDLLSSYKKLPVVQPLMDDEMLRIATELIALSKEKEGTPAEQLLQLINQDEANELVLSFVPARGNLKDKTERLIDLLALQNVSAQMIRGVKLEEGKKSLSADVMLSVYDDAEHVWKTYDVETGAQGLPENFIAFQRGNASLVDVTGGKDSSIRYSVLKSLDSSFSMARHRAKNMHKETFFNYSIYNLPLDQQNALKWLMVFPLAILIVVLIRNVIGMKTMGTFTPMLISMALVETGFGAGLLCFSLIVGIGLAIRFLLSKFNLLLVPRISAVVVFVILIIQVCSIVGYQMNWQVASSALFFPIIIIAWIIERASIIWEEEGLHHAVKEVVCSVIAAIIIYFIIVNEPIRHVMFAFNELNLVILFLIMLLGTYTGYRLSELRRFAPLVQKKDK